MCLLVGAARVNPVAVAVIEVLDTIAGLTFVRLLGERFAEPISDRIRSRRTSSR